MKGDKSKRPQVVVAHLQATIQHWLEGRLVLFEENRMTQFDIDRLVAAATGETVDEIQRRGFCIADPDCVDHDPERSGPLILDWDSMKPMELPNLD